MKFHKSFKHALNMVMHSQLRSWLTILGIVIGVAAVISIMSLGTGLQNEVNSRLSGQGEDILTITAGASRAGGFGGFEGRPDGGGATATEEEIVLERTDLQALKGLGDVKLVDTQIRGSADAYYLAKQGSITVIGVDPSVWSQITTSTLSDGRMLGPTDTYVIVIGGRLASGFFGQNLGVNQQITIEGKAFRIVGILDDESTTAYMPIANAYDVLTDKERDIYDSFIVKIADVDALNQTMNDIKERLMIVRHDQPGKPTFSMSSNKERQEQMAQVTSSMTSFLTAIAAVALLVGAVGVANTMFTSVLERTKEIGVMKAVGARNGDIMMIFLLNACIIGLIGGILGIALGYLFSGLLPTLMGSSGGILGRFGAGSVITLQSVMLALGISLGIGTISGIIPAYKASKLKPVDALRYE